MASMGDIATRRGTSPLRTIIPRATRARRRLEP
jgi:hypothetical protein